MRYYIAYPMWMDDAWMVKSQNLSILSNTKLWPKTAWEHIKRDEVGIRLRWILDDYPTNTILINRAFNGLSNTEILRTIHQWEPQNDDLKRKWKLP